ncbi:MAG: hypothetical protein HC935_07015, partial [Pseudanabaena sp. SU_2_4]|nr:hypothetical protein [Pseudanabaena sp. SU_2_4]
MVLASAFWIALPVVAMLMFANLALPLNGDAMDSLSEFMYNDQRAKDFVTGLRSSMAWMTSLTAQGKFPDAVNYFVSSNQMPAIAELTGDI